jgi:hypothetical protein
MASTKAQFALEKAGAAGGKPTAYISIAGKPNLREIVAAQHTLFEVLPKFKGFGLKACPNCHSGLDKIVIDFGRVEIGKRLSNVISQPIRALPQDPTPIRK